MDSDSVNSILYFGQRLHHAVAREHGGTGDDGGRGNSVDAHQRGQADGEFANQMIERGLADVVGFAAVLGNDGVGGTGKHHGDWKLLIFEDPFRLARQQIISGDVDEERFVPLRFGELAAGPADGKDSGRVDDAIDSAELQNGEA